MDFLFLNLQMLDKVVFKCSRMKYLQISHSQRYIYLAIFTLCCTVMVLYRVRFFCKAVDLLCSAMRVVLSTPLHILALRAAVAIECRATFTRSLKCCHN